MKSKQQLIINNHNNLEENSLFEANGPISVAKENEELRRYTQEQLIIQSEETWLDEKSSESFSEFSWKVIDEECQIQHDEFLEEEFDLPQEFINDLDW